MQLTPEQLAEWETLAANAASAPWKMEWTIAEAFPHVAMGNGDRTSALMRGDAAFIAAAREGWPATIVALRDMSNALASWREHVRLQAAELFAWAEDCAGLREQLACALRRAEAAEDELVCCYEQIGEMGG